MTLAQGDPFVVGDIFSFQQAERMKDNWRAAAEPSNPQAGSLWSDSVNEKLFHRQAAAYKEILQVDTQIDGYVDLVLLSTLAAGGFGLRIDAYQDDTTGLTGLLRGAYIQASNGDIISTGTIRALELKAIAGRPGEVGNDVAVLEGLSISADAKVYDITTVMRGAEIILEGGAGASIVKAVGIRIANNFQADIATLCYALEIYRDSFDYDADIALSSGGLIGGSAGHVKVADDGTTTLTAKGLLLEGTARVTKEIILAAAYLERGVTAPDLSLLGDFLTWSYDINDDSVITALIPDDWAPGTDIIIKVHWFIDEAYAADKEVKWQCEYSLCPHDETEAIDAPTHSGTLTSSSQNIPAVAKRLTETQIGAISAASISAGDEIGLTLTRIAADNDDPTADPQVVHLEIMYTANKLGIAT